MNASAENPNCRRVPGLLVVGLLALALLVRCGVLVLMPDSLSGSPDAYRDLAENMLEWGTFGNQQVPTAYRPPLYPLVLTGCVAWGEASRTAIGVLHLVLGLATVWLVFCLGRRCGLGNYAVAAAALVACDPILLAASAVVMSETLATLLVVVGLVSLSRLSERPSLARAATAGGVLAAAGLCRPVMLVWMAACTVLLAVLAGLRSGRSNGVGPSERPAAEAQPPRSNSPARWRPSALGAFLAAAAVVLAPWALRNQIQFGRPIFATTHGGYTLLLGNNPHFYQYLRSGRWGSVWDARELDEDWLIHGQRISPAGELRSDRLAYAKAWESIRREPGMFAYSCLVRIGRLWGLVPHQLAEGEGTARRLSRYAVGIWYLAETILAIVGCWVISRGSGDLRPATSIWLWGLVLAGCVTAVHGVYWSNMRMRAPLIPLVALAAAAAMAWLGSRTDSHKRLAENDLRH